MKTSKIIVVLIISLHVFSCFGRSLYEKPIKSLQLYFSFEEPHIVVYGHEKELITFKNILEDVLFISLYYRFNKKEGGWATNFDSNLEDLSYPTYKSSLDIGEIQGIKNGASSLILSWQEDIKIDRNSDLIDGVLQPVYDTIFLFTPDYFDNASCDVLLPHTGYGPKPGSLTLSFSSVSIGILVAKKFLFGDGTSSYGLTFQEIERDERGILFDLVLINNRSIEDS